MKISEATWLVWYLYLHVQEVDVVDDLHVSGKDGLQHGARPALQGLGQHCVVGVGTGTHSYVPSLRMYSRR